MNNITMDNPNSIEGAGGWKYNQLVISDTYGKTKEKTEEELVKTIQTNFNNEKSLAKTIEERGNEENWIPPLD
ncbi:MAG TPA: hypothetical protein VJ892_02110 [Candidatus Absconditabacterales bacterium]|nr:hypothetical protein [Candidatus Absconditabacterales bacterium]